MFDTCTHQYLGKSECDYLQQTSRSLKWSVEREAKEEEATEEGAAEEEEVESAASASVGNDRLLQELWTKRHPNQAI